ncbi:MAG: helix-turn-helix transcriptional regulator [bacterium]
MVDRILELLKEKNLTPSQFADEIGIQRSGMSHLVSGRNKPSLEFIMKVLKRFPDVRPEYLLYGTSGMLDETEDNQGQENIVAPKSAPDLFDQPGRVEIKSEPRPVRQVKPGGFGKKIEKIVVFYDDKTFREYQPE